MSSQRFPGKALHKVAGKPILQYLLERLDHCSSLDGVVIATSTEDSDTPIVHFCLERGVTCYRGSLYNVAGRFKEVLDVYHFDGFVRVSGDSPLLDQRLIEKGVGIFLKGDFDIVTNILPRTYPAGQSVEVLRSNTFRRAYRLMREDEDLEHVTRYFYKNRCHFRLFNFASGEDHSKIHLSVDTERDMNTFAAIIARMDRPHWQYGLREILQFYQDVVQ